MQKQPQHGTKKSQAGGWPKKRLKNDGNVTFGSGTAQRQRLMCVFSEIRVVPSLRVLRGVSKCTQCEDIQEPIFKKKSRKGVPVAKFTPYIFNIVDVSLLEDATSLPGSAGVSPNFLSTLETIVLVDMSHHAYLNFFLY
jgi:hypothetical protein